MSERNYMPETKSTEVKESAFVTSTPSQNEDEQMSQLRNYLSTSNPFTQCRGKLGHGWLDLGILEGSPARTPSAVMEELARRTGQAKILLNHAAKLRRDGKMRAYLELVRALKDPEFILTGEESPLDKRTPGVLVMFNPKRNMDLLRLVQIVDPLTVDLCLGKGDDHAHHMVELGEVRTRPELTGWIQSVLSQNPDVLKGLEKWYTSERSKFRPEYMPNSLHKDVFDDNNGWLTDKQQDRCVRRGNEWLKPAMDQRYDYIRHDVLANWPIALFFNNKTQREVLSLFKREHQKDVATWQFYYPTHMSHLTGYSVSIGLFPESEISRFTKRWPTHTSKSLNEGMGAVMLEGRDDDNDPLKMMDPLFDFEATRKQEETPDPEKVGLRLFFSTFAS